jgi:putative transcription antitermination factor YqgF
MKYLSFDPGLKHIGIAISHEGKTVLPHHSLTADTKEELINLITKEINLEKPDCVIIGQPQKGPLNLFAHDIKKKLSSLFPKTLIYFQTEDLSSEIAKKKLFQINAGRQKRSQLIHSASAAIILEDYLENHP